MPLKRSLHWQNNWCKFILFLTTKYAKALLELTPCMMQQVYK